MVEMHFRSRQLTLLALFLLLVIILFNAGGWLLLGRAAPYLDRQLGQRLQAIAATGALGLDPDLVEEAGDPGAQFLLADQLDRIKRENELEMVSLFNSDGALLASTSHLFQYGQEDPTAALDQTAMTLAASGLPSASRLYNVDDFFLKSGYAPVRGMGGEVRAILGVEASAAYFEVLNNFKKTMLILGGVSLLFLLVVGLLFLKLSYSLAQAEMAVLRADALTTLGRMAAHMAHEIRNPLSIIRGAVERLGASSSVPAADRELLGFLPEEVDRLDEIVSRYLDFARIDPLRLEPVDLRLLVEETTAMASRELLERGVRVHISAPETLPVIRLDAPRIKQALLNLLLNAAEAMPQGGDVRISLSQIRKSIRLDLSDTGVGISKAHLAKIFEPFYTTKEKGSGLGLATVAKVVEDHRGEIRVDSRPNEGTTFSIFLPL